MLCYVMSWSDQTRKWSKMSENITMVVLWPMTRRRMAACSPKLGGICTYIDLYTFPDIGSDTSLNVTLFFLKAVSSFWICLQELCEVLYRACTRFCRSEGRVALASASSCVAWKSEFNWFQICACMSLLSCRCICSCWAWLIYIYICVERFVRVFWNVFGFSSHIYIRAYTRRASNCGFAPARYVGNCRKCLQTCETLSVM